MEGIKQGPEANKPKDVKESRQNLTKFVLTLQRSYDANGVLTVPEEELARVARGIGAGIAYFCTITVEEDGALQELFRRLRKEDKEKTLKLMTEGTVEMLLSNVFAARDARLERERQAAEDKQQKGPSEAVA